MKTKKFALVIAMLTSANCAFAATAYWTGNVRYVTTVTYQQGVNCEYNYAGKTFWRTFVGGTCPSTVQVQ
jgi:hypothetical protein